MATDYYYSVDIPLPHFRDQASFVTVPAVVADYSEIFIARVPESDLIRGFLAFNQTSDASQSSALLKKLADDHPGCEVISYPGALLKLTRGQDGSASFHFFHSNHTDSDMAVLAVPDEMLGKALWIFEIDANRSGRTSFIVIDAERENTAYRLPTIIAELIHANGLRSIKYEKEPILNGLTSTCVIPQTELTGQPTAYKARLHYQEKLSENRLPYVGRVTRLYQSAAFMLSQPGVFLALGDFFLFLHSGPVQAVVSGLCGLAASYFSVRNSMPFLRQIWRGQIRDLNPLRLMDRMWVTTSRWEPRLELALTNALQNKTFLGKHADLVMAAVGAYACGAVSLTLGLVGGLSVLTVAPAIMGIMFGTGTLMGALRTHYKTDEPLKRIFQNGLVGKFARWLDKPQSVQRYVFRFMTNPAVLLGIGYCAAGAFGITGFGAIGLRSMSIVNAVMLAVSTISAAVVSSRIVMNEIRNRPYSQGREQMQMANGVVGPMALASLITNPAAGLALFSHVWGETIYGVQEGISAVYQRMQERIDTRVNFDNNSSIRPPDPGSAALQQNNLTLGKLEASPDANPSVKMDSQTSYTWNLWRTCRNTCKRALAMAFRPSVFSARRQRPQLRS
jgi:hypothetical protein